MKNMSFGKCSTFFWYWLVMSYRWH